MVWVADNPQDGHFVPNGDSRVSWIHIHPHTITFDLPVPNDEGSGKESEDKSSNSDLSFPLATVGSSTSSPAASPQQRSRLQAMETHSQVLRAEHQQIRVGKCTIMES